MLECPTREALQAYAQEQARQNAVPWGMLDRQFEQESHWKHCRDDGTITRSPSNALGVCQIIARWHPDVDPTDPWASLTYAIRWIKALHDQFGTWKLALMAYNWGPQAVRDWQTAGADDAAIRGETRRYLDVILGPGWPEPTTGTNDGQGTGSMVIYEDYTDPSPAGTFPAMPRGVILHGSRSGKAGNPKDAEYAGTARYEQTNPNDLGWHATIGEGKVALHLTPKQWGWHALQASRVYLGVEFAQATVDEPITDPQVAAFCDWFKTRVQPAWPNLPITFISHAEADKEQNVQQGKTDAFPLNDPRMDDLRARIMAQLEGAPVVAPDAPTYAVGPGILDAMKARGDQPASDEMFTKRGEYDEWSEAYGTSGRRYLWLPSVGRIFVYEPAA